MPTLVGSVITANGSGDMISQVQKTGCTAGNGLVMAVYWAGGSADPSPLVSGETVLTAGSSVNNPSMGSCRSLCQIFYIKSLATGGTKTFDTQAQSWSNSGWSAFLMEVSAQDTASFHDVNASA